MIEHWKNTYLEYMKNLGVTDEKKALENWIIRSTELMETWQKIQDGELESIYKSFPHFLKVTCDYYEQINGEYTRGSIHRPENPVVNEEKRRYWL